MATCAYCNTTILFGGRKQGELRFCNAECERKGAVAAIARAVPADHVRRRALQVHAGACPLCAGSGPVDVYTSYRVWSAVALTSWSSRPAVCCGACGTRRALGDAVFSLLLGWWGLPWGLLMTPVQIIRNVVTLVRRPAPHAPTPALEQMVRLQIAQEQAQLQRAPGLV